MNRILISTIIILFPSKMSSGTIPPLIQYIQENIKLLSPYYEDIKAKTHYNTIPEYEGAIYFIAKKLLEDAYLSGDSFQDVSLIEIILDKVTFASIYECYANKTIQAFIDEIRHIANEYGNNMIVEDIKHKFKQFNYMTMVLSVIQSISEEFINSIKFNIEDNDKEGFLYWIWLIFCLFNQNLFSKTYELSLTIELLSYVLQEVGKKINDNSVNFFGNEYYFGLIQEKLSKTTLVFSNKNYLTNDSVQKIYLQIGSFFPKGKFLYSNEEEVFMIKEQLEQEVIKGMTKDDISIIHIYKSFAIETFDKQIQMINMNLQQRQHQRIFTTPDSVCFNSIKLKIGLEVFIEDLKAYNYLDITFLYAKHSILSFHHPPFLFRGLYQSFRSKYMIKFAQLNLKFNCSFVKSLFIKLIHNSLTQKVIEQSSIYSEEFYYNFLIVTFYIYFNLQFIENQKVIINLTYTFIRTINAYPLFSFIEVYNIVSSLMKLPNIPFNLRTIIRKMQHDLLSFCLFEEKSFLYKYISSAGEIKPEPKIAKIIIDDFYQYCFDIIYKLGNKLNFLYEKKEEIFKCFYQIVTSIEDINTFIKNSYVDIIIIIVIACYQAKLEDDLKGEFNKVKLRYIEEKKKSLLPEFFKEFLQEDNENNFQLLKDIYTLLKNLNQQDQIDKMKTKASIMETEYDCKAFLIKATQHFNTIYSCSFSPQKTDNFNSDLLSRKRIRALTPTIQDKTLHTSPFISKTSNYPNKPAGAFKNLNTQFYSDKK